jgi:hypothetical protein
LLDHAGGAGRLGAVAVRVIVEARLDVTVAAVVEGARPAQLSLRAGRAVPRGVGVVEVLGRRPAPPLVVRRSIRLELECLPAGGAVDDVVVGVGPEIGCGLAALAPVSVVAVRLP